MPDQSVIKIRGFADVKFVEPRSVNDVDEMHRKRGKKAGLEEPNRPEGLNKDLNLGPTD